MNVTTFAQMQNAINNAPINVQTTITVTASFNMTGRITIPANKDIIIKSDGTVRTLTRASGVTGNLFTVNSDGTLAAENIIIDGNKDAAMNVDGFLVRVESGGIFSLNTGAKLQNNTRTAAAATNRR